MASSYSSLAGAGQDGGELQHGTATSWLSAGLAAASCPEMELILSSSCSVENLGRAAHSARKNMITGWPVVSAVVNIMAHDQRRHQLWTNLPALMRHMPWFTSRRRACSLEQYGEVLSNGFDSTAWGINEGLLGRPQWVCRQVAADPVLDTAACIPASACRWSDTNLGHWHLLTTGLLIANRDNSLARPRWFTESVCDFLLTTSSESS